MRDLAVGKFLHMNYHDVRALPLAVYLVALEEITTAGAEHAAQEALA